MLDAVVQPRRDPPQDLRAVAFYLPQYHPVPENDRFWGAGFTEWRNVVRARPRFRGHHQPHLPADLGFYDLRLSEVRAAQVDLARGAGLSGFCYYHYWFSGRRILHRPFDEVLSSGAPDFPFMLCWANENWTRAWDGGAREVIVAQRYSDDDTIAHARHIAPALADPRYITIDNRPAFVVYNTDALPDPNRWSDVFRTALAREGIDPFLIRAERWLDRDRRSPAALGFNAALDFQPFSRSFRCWLEERPDLRSLSRRRIAHRFRRAAGRFCSLDTHYDLRAFVAYDKTCSQPPYLRFPGLCPSWDNSARRPPGQAIIFRNSTPKLFQDWLASKVRTFRPRDDKNLLFINAWNEWAEGNHLEPCLEHGHAWLNSLRAVLGRPSMTEALSPMHCRKERIGQ